MTKTTHTLNRYLHGIICFCCMCLALLLDGINQFLFFLCLYCDSMFILSRWCHTRTQFTVKHTRTRLLLPHFWFPCENIFIVLKFCTSTICSVSDICRIRVKIIFIFWNKIVSILGVRHDNHSRWATKTKYTHNKQSTRTN